MRRHDPGLHRAVVTDVIDAVRSLVEEERFGALVTVISGPDTGRDAVVETGRGVVAGTLPDEIEDAVVRDSELLTERERPATVTYGPHDVFVSPVVPRPRLLVFGAVHVAQMLCGFAADLGYRVVVADARAAFATSERFPRADEILVGWPDAIADRLTLDAATYVVVLSHDARFEDPLWPLVLGSGVRYLGAMGSRRTAAARRERLLAAGFPAEEVDRICGPVGLDIGAESAGEVALSILAEMTRVRHRPDVPLELEGEIRRIEKR